jgi:hypothetical protein
VRDGRSVPAALADVDVRAVSPGPKGSLFLLGRRAAHLDVGLLFFPDEGTFIPIESELFESEPETRKIWWSDAADALFALTQRMILKVPGARLHERKRFDARTGRAR